MLNTNNKFTQPVFQFNLFNMCNVFLDNIYIYIYIYIGHSLPWFLFLSILVELPCNKKEVFTTPKRTNLCPFSNRYSAFIQPMLQSNTQTIHTVSVSIIVISCTMTMTVKLFELLFLSWGTIKSLSILINGLRVKSLFCIYFS